MQKQPIIFDLFGTEFVSTSAYLGIAVMPDIDKDRNRKIEIKHIRPK